MPQKRLRAASPAEPVAIRAARPGDLDNLLRIEAASFATDRLSSRSFRSLMARPSAVLLVAEGGASVLGYALILTRRSSRIARLYSIAVDPSAAGAGIGGQILAAAEAAAAERGARALRLEVRADNGAAIRLYEARGYRPFGRRAGYYGDGMDAIRYERGLDGRGIPARPLGRAA